ncbi:MAG: hypothetical protein V1782_12715, partial [Pseudomonadota bacterium]
NQVFRLFIIRNQLVKQFFGNGHISLLGWGQISLPPEWPFTQSILHPRFLGLELGQCPVHLSAFASAVVPDAQTA